ncbi:MAG: heme A synthase [Ignavibacteriales bacterium]|nr:heme A synthase [Ignavibacteriales bacterium]
MREEPKYNKGLHRFTVFSAVSTFLLIVAGGMVTSTGSGLAVPDWPLSYGQVMPPMVGGIFYEHGHRMIASFVGLLTVILAIWLWRRESRGWVRQLGFAALAAVIVQGVLGGLTVLYLLPTPISVSHAALAQTFFCVMASLALFTSRWWHTEHPIAPRSRGVSLLTAAGTLTVAIYVQLILGAVMRHTQSGLAVPDFPLAYGSVFPPLDAHAMNQYNDELFRANVRIFADGPITAGQITIHLLHRYWAIVVLGLSAWTILKTFRSGIDNPRLRVLGLVLLIFMGVQVTVGALTVLLRKDAWLTTAHVANGAFLLCLSVLLVLHAARLYRFSWISETVRISQAEAIA